MPCTYRRVDFQWRLFNHPFIQDLVPSSGSEVARFRSPAAGALLSLVREHVVQGRIIFPGAGYLEVMRAATHAVAPAMTSPALQGIFFLQPLFAAAPALHVQCVLADDAFEIRSGGVDEGWATHGLLREARGVASRVAPSGGPSAR